MSDLKEYEVYLGLKIKASGVIAKSAEEAEEIAEEILMFELGDLTTDYEFDINSALAVPVRNLSLKETHSFEIYLSGGNSISEEVEIVG